MKLEFPPEINEFRLEVRTFIDDHLPDETRRWMRLGNAATKDQTVEWQRILNTRGWATPAWPVEYGGAGLNPLQRMVLMDEIFRAPAPEPLPQNSLMVGPLLIRYGTEEQKARFLPKMASLDYWFCQGFSEPGAGSDLASLTTRAVRDGDHYVVNGQKTWTSSAHYANWIFCLVRTEVRPRKQEGISFLLIELSTPGIEIRPIISIDGAHKLNEVFFDNVRVPVSGLLGEENKGWDLGKFLLGYERTSIARVGRARERLSYALELAAIVRENDRPLLESDTFRERAAWLDAELRALEITELRVIAADMKSTSGRADPFSSILKIKGAEMLQATNELVFDVAGPAALAARSGSDYPANWANDTEEWAAGALPAYLSSRAGTIYGGSNEIQKNILSKLVLGL